MNIIDILKKTPAFFVPKSVSINSAEYFKSYFQSATLLTTTVLAGIYFFICLKIEFTVGALVCSYLFIGHLLLLFSIKNLWFSSIQITHIFGLLTFTGLGMAIIYSGGPTSPVAFWHVATLVVSFWFGSRKVTRVWVVLSIAQVLAFFIGQELGVNYPVMLNREMYPFFKTMMSVGIIIYLSIVFMTFNKWRQKALDELTLLIQSKDRMLAMIAHDFNNPLTLLHIYTSGLRDGEELTPHMLSSFESLNRKMKIIVENLVLYDKLVNRHFKKDLSEFSLHELIKNIKSDFDFLAKSRSIEIHTELGQDVVINSDKNALDRILTNLLSNAIKYSPKNKTIKISLINSSELHISDQGLGLSKEMLERVFDIYDQKNALIHANDSSHGIGLNIVKSLCDELNIKITVLSDGKDQGCCFILKFPAKSFIQQKIA